MQLSETLSTYKTVYPSAAFLTQFIDPTQQKCNFVKVLPSFSGGPRQSTVEHNGIENDLYSFTVPKARQADDSANLSKHKLGILKARSSLLPGDESQGL